MGKADADSRASQLMVPASSGLKTHIRKSKLFISSDAIMDRIAIMELFM